MNICKVENCVNKNLAKNLCRMHYLRMYRHNSLEKRRGADYAPRGKDCPHYKHGQWNHSLYPTWNAMLKRCYKASDPAYKNYGGRGINVCDRWRDINNFIMDMGKKPLNTSLDRINNNGNYEPSNCRWATPVQQSRNLRTNKLNMETARLIRKEYPIMKNKSQRKLAEKFNVSISSINKVLTNKYWYEEDEKQPFVGSK